MCQCLHVIAYGCMVIVGMSDLAHGYCWLLGRQVTVCCTEVGLHVLDINLSLIVSHLLLSLSISLSHSISPSISTIHQPSSSTTINLPIVPYPSWPALLVKFSKTHTRQPQTHTHTHTVMKMLYLLLKESLLADRSNAPLLSTTKLEPCRTHMLHTGSVKNMSLNTWNITYM